MIAYPRKKEQFDRRRDKLMEGHFINRIDALFEMQVETIIAAHYGSYVKAGVALVWKGIQSDCFGFYWHCVFRLADKLGWTQLRSIPGTTCFERHGHQCDKLNCRDLKCVNRGIPGWYRRLTGMQKGEL